MRRLVGQFPFWIIVLAVITCSAQSPSNISPTTLAKAKSGDVAAELQVGLAYEFGHGIQQDFAQAAEWYKKAASQGNAEAQEQLAGLFIRGMGVTQDYGQAAVWFRKAAEQGNPFAQDSLGSLFPMAMEYRMTILWRSLGIEELQIRDLWVRNSTLHKPITKGAVCRGIMDKPLRGTGKRHCKVTLSLSTISEGCIKTGMVYHRTQR